LKISEIEQLSLSPFWLSKLISHFVEGYGKETPFELTYILLPLVLRQESREALSKLNANSTIYSAFLDHRDKRLNITALQHYVEAYSKYVNPSLIVYANAGHSFGKCLQNSRKYDFKKEKSQQTKKFYKAAYYLGVIFSKEETKDCFYKLGVFKV
tara:strand:+ start:289 stop:753 length:465 start_codon:yes stop_codon:yes gene_type:complete